MSDPETMTFDAYRQRWGSGEEPPSPIEVVATREQAVKLLRGDEALAKLVVEADITGRPFVEHNDRISVTRNVTLIISDE